MHLPYRTSMKKYRLYSSPLPYILGYLFLAPPPLLKKEGRRTIHWSAQFKNCPYPPPSLAALTGKWERCNVGPLTENLSSTLN